MTSPQFSKRPCRPREHLAAAGKLYPRAWKQADEFRADRGRDGLPDWPDWCYLPLAGWYAIVSGGGDNRLGLAGVSDVARLGAIGAWRVTQGIYRFDPALYDRVIDTPVAGDVPHDVLYRMPEWCVYIETPGMQCDSGTLHGFFAHLEHDANTGRPELRLLLDTEDVLLPIPLHLGAWSLAESIARMTDAASVHAVGAGMGAIPATARGVIRGWAEPLVSLLLYLCAENAEIGDGSRAPANPAPKRTKSGWRLFPPDRPTTWDVGVRIGAALRRAYHAQQIHLGGTHASPRPHIRRAHWATYWIGKKSSPQTSVLKWLPPIAVNLDDLDALPATIRPVKL